jgi:hypothetical protein
MRNYSKGTYTVGEIAQIVFKKCPGRFKSVSIAHRQVNKTMAKLGIGDINGKKRCMLITLTDAEKVITEIVNGRTKKRRKAEQVSLAEFFDADQVEWLEPYTPHTKKKEEQAPEPAPTPEGMTAEQAEAVEKFWRAWVGLCKAMGNDGEVI